ncbi:hypothetical protein [Haloarchaeobius iranensis]|uniref:Uncharacterized protein n=1 Tax=Haloarchaeobius iranensis TaxID=996166 RepID=A0A1H0A608_9EURY|nr:hypothetical protein [Haloarchaeobius iranensis]SDN28684.1 hypothetical protein SAMN05192554_1253 [Haloarchaeobius iranensis]
MFEKVTLVELRVEDPTVGGAATGDDESARESMAKESSESEEQSRRSIGARVRRIAMLGAVLGAVAAVTAVARRVRGRRGMADDRDIELAREDDVELPA